MAKEPSDQAFVRAAFPEAQADSRVSGFLYHVVITPYPGEPWGRTLGHAPIGGMKAAWADAANKLKDTFAGENERQLLLPLRVRRPRQPQSSVQRR